MATAIFQTKGRTMGLAQLGFDGTVPGSPEQQVHDGDTANIEPAGNLSVRFLGVDAPEVSLSLPAADGEGERAWISDQRWEEFLLDPFTVDPILSQLDSGLRAYLAPKVGPDVAKNHAILACEATRALKAEVENDMAELGQDEKTFKLFLAFASETMDGYGRLLAYLNRSQPKSPPRPLSYNERLLQKGWVVPYFIWPNLNPYLKQPSLVEAVPKPQSALPARAEAADEKPLDDARKAARKARDDERGVWGKDGPLRLLPFELRFLARRKPPDRWVIDLSAEDDKLLAPHLYYKIEHPEDRLFVPAQYVPLFVEEGWKRVRS